MIFTICRTYCASTDRLQQPHPRAEWQEVKCVNARRRFEWNAENLTGKLVDVVEEESRGVWCIEINSIEELVAFVENLSETDEIVISTDSIGGLPSIEIYDDYRE